MSNHPALFSVIGVQRTMAARVLLLALLLLQADAIGCTCGSPPACSAVSDADVVFVGRALEDAPGSSGWVRFRVHKVYKGWLVASVVQVDLGLHSCSYFVQKDEVHLIFANRGRFFLGLHTASCSGNTLASVAEPDLEFLARWAEGLTPTSILGAVYWVESRGEEGLREQGNRLLVGETKIQAVHESGRRFEVPLRADGSFLLEPVLEGSYRFSIEGKRWVFPGGEDVVTVERGGCTAKYLSAIPDGRLEGRVVNRDGTPASSIPVSLLGAHGESLYPRQEATSDETGHYYFRGVGPGEYILAANVTSGFRLFTEDGYPTSFFPDASTEETAEPIVMGMFESISLPNFILRPKGRRRWITVRVSLEDGSPVHGANVAVFERGKSPARVEGTDTSGLYRVETLDNLSYVVDVSLWSGHSLRRVIGDNTARWTEVPPGGSTTVGFVYEPQ